MPTKRADGSHVQIGSENAIRKPCQMNSGAAAQIDTHNDAITTDTPVTSAEAVFDLVGKSLEEAMKTFHANRAYLIKSGWICCQV